MYLNSGKKEDCSGCSACQQVCGHNAIKMLPDKDGFIFPVKDYDLCIDCGLCNKVCPFEHTQYKNDTISVYAALAKDLNERSKSSSGALFYIIAKKIIELGGVVYGATMDGNLQIRHIAVDDIANLENLRGSKYVQSDLGNVYRDIREILKTGRPVYFTGVGCQVAGLKSFLIRDYDNLITSDLVCHGIPSQELFNEHINFIEKKYNSKVKSYSFRDNTKWTGCECVKLESNANSRKSKSYKLPTYNLSPYLYSFMNAMTFRMSCYNCPFAKIPRQGDITLADFWGINKFFPEIDSSKGASLILINSKMGNTILERIKEDILLKESNLNEASYENKNLVQHTEMPPIRASIFDIIRLQGYPYVAKKYFRPNNYLMLLIKCKVKDFIGLKVYRYIRKLIKWA